MAGNEQTAPRCAVGIDVGATNTKIGLVQAAAVVEQHPVLLDHRIFPSRLGGSDPGPFLEELEGIITGYTKSCPLAGIGVSLCSLINAEHTGAFLSVNAPALNHLNIKETLEKRFACPVQVRNDVNAYATAEYHFGAGRGARRMLCLALGTGLAIACFIDGRAIETWGGIPGEAGRIILQPDAEAICNAGVRGSAEALIGTARIERLARAAYGCETITAREVIQAARTGQDAAAAKIMTEVGGHVGHLLAILSPVFFPERIIITGGTAEAGEAFFNAIRERHAALIGGYMRALAEIETGSPRPVDIVKGSLGPEAAILGSVFKFLALSGSNGYAVTIGT